MKFDLHCHTKYSPCGSSEPKEILKVASKKLDGIAITDHNQTKGALEVKRLNKNKNLKIIIGEEIKTPQCEILAYNVTEKIKPADFDTVLDKIKEQGAISSLAHPYAIGRQKATLTVKQLKRLDAIETFNARTLFKGANLKAKALAIKLHKAQTAGSDAHIPKEIGRAYIIINTTLKQAIKMHQTKVKGTNKFSILYRIESYLKKTTS